MRVERTDWQGLRAWRLRGPDGASALVAGHGAQLLAWTPADGRERLFLAPRRPPRPGAAIRGGVPVVFPQFGAGGPLPRHGFARTRPWRLVEAGARPDRVAFELHDDAATRAAWPHVFRATLAVQLEARAIELSFAVENRGDAGFGFTAALHTYLRTAGRVRVGPLAGGPIDPDGAVDRVFADAPATQWLCDDRGTLAIQRRGFPDTVVWNPGPAPLDDLPPEAWRSFVCVEAACALRPVRLAPGMHWCGHQRLEVVGG